MKKRVLFTVLIVASTSLVYPYEFGSNEHIEMLDETLEQSPLYEHAKCVKIDSLLKLLYCSVTPYDIQKKIFDEYKSYNYDNALYYAHEMQQEAHRLQDADCYLEANIANAFVYLSGGLFKESYDLLEGLEEQYSFLPDEYYFTFARLLWDMADYAGGKQAVLYDEKAASYLNHIISHRTPADSAQYWYLLSALDLRQHNFPRAIVRLQEALLDSKCTDHDKAIYESSMAYAYYQLSDIEQAFIHYILAAVYDVRSCTHETTALRMVAQIAYEQGETALAERYIRLAMKDATLYNARHRQVEIAQILPIIEQKQAETNNRYKNLAIVFLCVLFFLLILCVFAIFSLRRRNKIIRLSRQTIDDMNTSLMVANKLKEEMISTYLAGISQYLATLEQYQKRMKEDITQRRYAELMVIPKNVDAHLRRIAFNKRLDETLIKLYPAFVQDFNRLLRPEEQFAVKPDELFNTQMRIFALIRLGIKDNEKIAEILGCSVNTVYTYKTRTILRSDLDPDAFYAALMRIES